MNRIMAMFGIVSLSHYDREYERRYVSVPQTPSLPRDDEGINMAAIDKRKSRNEKRISQGLKPKYIL